MWYGSGKGYVYIFRNTRNHWIKIGMTANPVDDRLKAINKINPVYYNNDKRLPLATWIYECCYLVERFGDIEKLAHKYLDEYLVKDAPFGEVFNCSVEQGYKAIEDAMKELGVEQENIIKPKDV